MARLEKDRVFYEEDENGNKVVRLPITRVNNVEGIGRYRNTSYSVGAVVYTDTNLSIALKCTQAGTTSNTELDLSSYKVGDTVSDGSVVWEVIARSNVLDENGVVPIANGGTGGNTFIKSASISGKTITLNMSDGTTKTLITQDTKGHKAPNYSAGVSKTWDTLYTAESDGWIYAKANDSTAANYPYLTVSYASFTIFEITAYSGGTCVFVPVQKGYEYKASGGVEGSRYLIFYPCVE